MIDYKIINAYVVTVNSEFLIIENGCVCIENDTIAHICETCDSHDIEAETVIDAQGNLLLPGFINAHTHAGMNIFKGYADDLPLQQWLFDYVFPVEAKFTNRENVKIGSSLALLEMIASGTTCFADMYYFVEETARLCEEIGMRAILSQPIVDFPVADAATPDEALQLCETLMQRFANHHLVQVVPAPHSIYTCSAEYVQKARALANRFNAPLHTHLSETAEEYNNCIEQHAKTPIEYLNDLGCFDGKTIAAHCVYVSENDREILAQKRVCAVNNMQSNLKLVSGVSPVPELLESGVKVCFGTDSVVSNNSLDMYTEIKTAALVHKYRSGNASALGAQQTVFMATRGAAECLGIDHLCGSIEVGKKADLQIVNINQIHVVPLYNIYSHIVYALQGGDVDTVFINGKCVYLHKHFQGIDAFDVMVRAQELANTIIDEMANR
ncbi:MAG: amidohydrolase [Bacteroidales bacterium]|jgi:5-methylthioadenosine/S-adenosylhomocysteine deaminase|nr:amidohydrolase [Bacteroidales bacterium]